MFRTTRSVCGATLFLALTATAVSLAAPPEGIAKPRSIVGKLVSVGSDYVVVATTQEVDGKTTDAEVRVPLRAETTIKLNDEPAALADLRAGDGIKINPYDDALGVAQSISAARADGSKPPDAEAVALENRARRAAERGDRLESVEQRRDDQRMLTQGNVFLMRLPAGSAAARAGFRPGDIVVFVGDSDPDIDTDVLRGLRVERLGARGGFVIEGSGGVPIRGADVDPLTPRDVIVPEKDVDVKIEIDRE